MGFLSYLGAKEIDARFKKLEDNVQTLVDRTVEMDALRAENARLEAAVAELMVGVQTAVQQTDQIEAGARQGLPTS